MKRILTIISVLALAACSNEVLELPKTEEATLEEQSVEGTIKVMSSNIRHKSADAGELAWSARKHPYIAMISDIQPDVIGMQEVAVEQQYQDLLLLTEYDRYRIDLDTYTGTLETDVIQANSKIDGNVMILWKNRKFDKLDAGYFWFGDKPDEPWYWPFDATDQHCRGVAWVKLRVKTTGKIFYMFNTHYMYDPEDKPSDFNEDGSKKYNVEPRRKCSELIIERVREIVTEEDAMIFLTADFNCSLADGSTRNGGYSLAPLSEYFWCAKEAAKITDSYISFNGFSDSARAKSANIDYIFYRGATAEEYATIVSDGYGVKWISDHYPITCTFTY